MLLIRKVRLMMVLVMMMMVVVVVMTVCTFHARLKVDNFSA